MAIKPGYLNIYCQKYNKEMVLKYLSKIREADVVNYGFLEEEKKKNKIKGFKILMHGRMDYSSSSIISNQKQEPIRLKQEDIVSKKDT